ncbi:hypothetical protein QQ045_019803 [Rhodiola kirilowii]
MEERRNVLETRVIRLIRFRYMSCGKIKDVLTCSEFELKSTYELVMEALFFIVEMHSPTAATLNRPRNYTCPRARVAEFDLSQPECGVYLDLKARRAPTSFPPVRFPTAVHLQQSEVLHLQLDGFAVVITNDDLHVPYEDHVFELALKYVRKKYPSMEERWNVLETRLICLFKFCYMSCGKIKNMLTCPKFELKSTYELVMEALFFMVEMQSASATLNRPRNYMCTRARVIEFDLSQPKCGVYLDLKREECANLFPTGKVPSQRSSSTSGAFTC